MGFFWWLILLALSTYLLPEVKFVCLIAVLWILPWVVCQGWEIKWVQRKSRQSLSCCSKVFLLLYSWDQPYGFFFATADVVTPAKSFMPVVTTLALSFICCSDCRERLPCLHLSFFSLLCQNDAFIWVRCQATSTTRTTPLTARIRSLLVTRWMLGYFRLWHSATLR